MRGRSSARTWLRRSPSGPCSSPRPSPMPGSPVRRRSRSLHCARGRCPVRDLRNLPGAGRRAELDLAIIAAAALVPVAATFPATQYPVLLAALAILTGATYCSWQVPSASASSRTFSPARCCRIHQRRRCRDHRRAASEAARVDGREREVSRRRSGACSRSLGDLRWRDACVGCVSLAALLVLRRVAPRVPWALVVAAVSIGCSRVLRLRSPRRSGDRRRAGRPSGSGHPRHRSR